MAGTSTKSGNKRKRNSLVDLLIGVLIIVLVNYIASFVFTRFDLTAEKRYTLSEATKKQIENLNDAVYFKVYLEGDFPSGFTRLRNEIKEMLDEFRAYADQGYIEYEFINPSLNPDQKVRNEVYRDLYKQGLRPTDLEVQDEDGVSKKIIWPGALVTYKERQVAIDFLKSGAAQGSENLLNNAIEDLEYELSNAIQKLTNVNKPKLAFIYGHGELDEYETADIFKALEEYYVVERITLDEQIGRLTSRKARTDDSTKTWVTNNYKAIIIAKPTEKFSDKDKFIIDQFVMYGGKVLWFLDPVMADMDSLTRSDFTLGIANDLNLNDQLFTYGVRLNSNLAQDLQAAPIPLPVGMVGDQPRYELFPWYYFPLLVPKGGHPIVNNLNAVKTEFVSSIDTVGKTGRIKKTPLLTTSRYTKLLRAPVRISLGITRYQPSEDQYTKGHTPVAYLLEGTFSSVFKNRMTQQIKQSDEIKYKDSSITTKMLVVADGDIIKNHVRSDRQILPLGVDRYTNQEYGNKDFVLNAVNYLCDDEGLMAVRARTLKIRLLDRARLKAEGVKWQLINTIVPVLMVLLFGVIHFYWRKRKYSRKVIK
jgi:ABC-2 type transport system permease protein